MQTSYDCCANVIQLLDVPDFKIIITPPHKALIARAVKLVDAYALAIDTVDGYAPKGFAHIRWIQK